MTYDDHMYCEVDHKHLAVCWCQDWPEWGDELPDDRCHEHDLHGRPLPKPPAAR